MRITLECLFLFAIYYAGVMSVLAILLFGARLVFDFCVAVVQDILKAIK